MYEVGLGDSPMSIAGYLGGSPNRLPELVAANPHKQLVSVRGVQTFAALGVGERLNVPLGFVGDALAEAFGVGTHEEAFDRLERTFGTSDPAEAFEKLEETFGVVSAPPPNPLMTPSPSAFGKMLQTAGQRVATSIEEGAERAREIAKLPAKEYVLAKQSQCWKGAKLKKVPASLLSVGGRPATYWNGTKSVPLPSHIHPQDMVTICWEDKGGGSILNDIGNAVESGVKSVGKAAAAPVEAVAKVAKDAAKETGKAVSSAAKFIEKTGGDAAKFLKDTAEKFAKDPMGELANLASTGGLSLVGVDPQKELAKLGIPTPDAMLKHVGLPTTGEIVHKSFESVTDPKALLDEIPGLQEITKYVPSMPDPTKMAGRLVEATLNGDLEGIKRESLAIGHMVADVAAMVPAVGNVVGGPLSSALTLIETGSALKAALALLLNEVPGIPPQIRSILRTAFNAIADIVEKSKSVTDVLLSEFKKGVKDEAAKYGVTGPIADIVEDVLDGAIQIIFKNKPLDRAALDLAKKGVEIAKEKVAQGVESPEVLKEAERALSDMKGVYDKVDSVHALTQGVVKLTEKLAETKDPALAKVIKKQIEDMRTSMEGEKLIAQAQGRKVKEIARKRPPQLRAGKRPAKAPPKLRAGRAPSAEQKALEALKALSPEEQKQLREFAALQKLSPEEQKALAALSPEERKQLAALGPKAREKLRQVVEKSAAAAAKAPTTRPEQGPSFASWPYPQAAAGVSAPPMHPRFRGHHGPHYGARAPLRPFAPHLLPLHHPGFRPLPVAPPREIVTRTERCRTWGPYIQMPHQMQLAAKAALGASNGNPTTIRGPDGVLYLFAYDQNGAITARGCADVVLG